MPEHRTLEVPAEAAGQRLDAFLAAQLDVSRSRIQLLLEQGDVVIDQNAPKASLKLRGGEIVTISGEPHPAPLKATAEDIPLTIVFEDANLAVIDKPAGMMVHAGSGQTEDARSGGTLVNALLHHFESLSTTGGELRPGIVHRLDKETSGLIIVAKNDRTHAKLADMFSGRDIRKTYIALVHGELARPRGTINAPIARDPVRRTRMTAKPQLLNSESARSAISHYEVLRKINNRFGKFTLVKVSIETGRTHQIRVHMASIGHPVVGDTLYGAASQITDQVAAQAATSRAARRNTPPERLKLDRNFLHAAELEFTHPVTRKPLQLQASLPEELNVFLSRLEGDTNPAHPSKKGGNPAIE